MSWTGAWLHSIVSESHAHYGKNTLRIRKARSREGIEVTSCHHAKWPPPECRATLRLTRDAEFNSSQRSVPKPQSIVSSEPVTLSSSLRLVERLSYAESGNDVGCVHACLQVKVFEVQVRTRFTFEASELVVGVLLKHKSDNKTYCNHIYYVTLFCRIPRKLAGRRQCPQN